MSHTIRRLAALAVILLAASAAWAHTSLEQAGTHLSRYGDAEIKVGPCGRANGTRGTNVYTYAPGETITVSAKEYISHSGYYRIAFDDDGDDGFADPASIEPESGRTCTSDPNDHCGASDYFNNATVLMDHLEPHAQNIFSQPTYTWQVTLPNVECDNCTLQIIQVMTENGKAPYDPSAAGANDLYYTCIDLVLAGAGATGGSGGVAAGEGGTAGTIAAGAGGVGGMPTAGTTATDPVTPEPTEPAPAGTGGIGGTAGTTGVAAAGGTSAPMLVPGGSTTDSGSGGGCAAGGASGTASAIWLLGLALVGIARRRARPRR